MEFHKTFQHLITGLAVAHFLPQFLRRQRHARHLIECRHMKRTETLQLAARIAADIVIAHDHHRLLRRDETHHFADILPETRIKRTEPRLFPVYADRTLPRFNFAVDTRPVSQCRLEQHP